MIDTQQLPINKAITRIAPLNFGKMMSKHTKLSKVSSLKAQIRDKNKNKIF